MEEEKIATTFVSDVSEDDYDAQKLKDLGYKQEFSRDISLFVQAGFSFSTMAVLPNWLVVRSAAVIYYSICSILTATVSPGLLVSAQVWQVVGPCHFFGAL